MIEGIYDDDEDVSSSSTVTPEDGVNMSSLLSDEDDVIVRSEAQPPVAIDHVVRDHSILDLGLGSDEDEDDLPPHLSPPHDVNQDLRINDEPVVIIPEEETHFNINDGAFGFDPFASLLPPNYMGHSQPNLHDQLPMYGPFGDDPSSMGAYGSSTTNVGGSATVSSRFFPHLSLPVPNGIPPGFQAFNSNGLSTSQPFDFNWLQPIQQTSTSTGAGVSSSSTFRREFNGNDSTNFAHKDVIPEFADLQEPRIRQFISDMDSRDRSRNGDLPCRCPNCGSDLTGLFPIYGYKASNPPPDLNLVSNESLERQQMTSHSNVTGDPFTTNPFIHHNHHQYPTQQGHGTGQQSFFNGLNQNGALPHPQYPYYTPEFFSRQSVETLMFAFYHQAETPAYNLAVDALVNLNWRFSKPDAIWICRFGSSIFVTELGELANFIAFNPSTWKFRLMYSYFRVYNDCIGLR